MRETPAESGRVDMYVLYIRKHTLFSDIYAKNYLPTPIFSVKI